MNFVVPCNYITIGLLLASYLLGAVPFGLIIARIKQVDLRKVGSGNIGATNVARSCGTVLGVVVFILDLAKGLLPVVLARFWLTSIDLAVCCALAAVLGHVFPVYLQFKGGKGVATACGVFLALTPIVTGICFLLWVLIVALCRYVALASIVAALALPSLFIAWHRQAAFGDYAAVTLLTMLVAALVIIRHWSNIGRLLAGTESKIGSQSWNC